jgi:hypothetical protein
MRRIARQRALTRTAGIGRARVRSPDPSGQHGERVRDMQGLAAPLP